MAGGRVRETGAPVKFTRYAAVIDRFIRTKKKDLLEP